MSEDQEKPTIKMPRADKSVEDFMSPYARIDMAVDQIKALAAEENAIIERRDELIFQGRLKPVFQAPARMTEIPMDRSAGYVSRGFALAALVGMFSIITMGQTKDGTRIIHDAACSLPLTNCAPR